MNKQTVTITGMTCDACVKLVFRRFTKVPDVLNVRVTLDGQAHVEANRVIDKEEFTKSLEGLPYNII